MSKTPHKSLMRCLGECAGYIMRAVREPVTSDRTVVAHKTEEARQGDVTLRRTTIDEIEWTPAHDQEEMKHVSD